VVVDDGSTDNSRDIISSYGDKIVSVFKPNGGQASSFNAGFAHCRGDIICFLDADDAFVPIKLTQIAACFKQQPEIGWCFHTLQLQDTHTGEPLGQTQAFPGEKRDCSQPCDFRKNIRAGNLPFYPVATSGLCFRRSMAQQILPMPLTFAKTSADRYLRIVSMGLAPGYFLAEALTLQGIHGSNISTLRKDRPFIPERQIVTAYLLRTQFPTFSLYANRLFSRGLNAYLAVTKHTVPEAAVLEPEYTDMIRDYWQLCSHADRCRIYLTRLYHRRPWRKHHPVMALALSPRMQRSPSPQRMSKAT
ncbi:MAG: glycosyltransferase family A protein, partial [Cyanobacteria bacterium J06649_4]